MFFMEIGIILAIAIPLIGGMLAVIRYFWLKEKCFVLMKAKIDELSGHDGDSNETHNDFSYRLTEIEKRQQKNEIYLKLLLKDRNIDYSD